MKLFSTTRKEKAYIAAGLVIAVFVVAYGSWRDMHPVEIKDPPISFNKIYYAGDQESLEKVPQDKYTIAALAGTFTSKDNQDSFVSSNIIPVNFAQREADLLFRIDGIPLKLDTLYDALDKKIDAWQGENNFFNTLYLQDINPDDSLEALDGLFLLLRNHFKHTFSLNVFIRRSALEKTKTPNTVLENMNKNVWTFIFDTQEAQKPDETLAQMILDLEKYQVPFIVAVHKMPDTESLRKALQDKTKHFQGFLLMTPYPIKAEAVK